MNKLAIALSAALSLGAATSANAAEATISFEGVITDTTCSVDLGGTGATGTTLTMPTVAADRIVSSSSNDAARQTAFTLTLGTASAPCPASSIAEITFSGSNINGDGALRNTVDPSSDGAEGVELALVHGATVLNLSTDKPEEAVSSAGIATYNMLARYRQMGATTIVAGQFATDVDLDIAYR